MHLYSIRRGSHWVCPQTITHLKEFIIQTAFDLSKSALRVVLTLVPFCSFDSVSLYLSVFNEKACFFCVHMAVIFSFGAGVHLIVMFFAVRFL